MNMTEALDELNFYRNQYYAAPLGTEERRLADAINTLLCATPAMKLYAVRAGETGKLVGNITSPGHRFWMRKGDCENAIRRHLQSPYRRYKSLDLVELDVYERGPKTRCAL